MIRLRKIRAVALFEFLSAIKRPSYALMTFGLPIFFGLLAGVPAMIQGKMVAEQVSRQVRWAIVDEAGVLDLENGPLEFDTLELFVTDDEAQAREALMGHEVEGYFALPADYEETGLVRAYRRSGGPPFSVGAASAEGALEHMLIRRLLIGKVTRALAERVTDPVTLERHEITPSGAPRAVGNAGLEAIARLLVPLVLATLLLMALMTTSGYLVQAIAVEKENKVVEILLSSADPDEILTGKLIGLGAAGLGQFAVWSSLFVAGALYMAGLLEDLAVPVPWGSVAAAPAFFIVGYLFVGSLMLATGSLGNTSTESQKFTLVWGLLSLLPMLMLTVLFQQPDGMLAEVFTWIPFTAPLTVILRMALSPGGLPWWEVAGALSMLSLCTWLSIRFGARLFRVGLLLSGSWPGFRELMRQARLR